MRFCSPSIYLALLSLGHAAPPEEAGRNPTPRANGPNVAEVATGQLAPSLQLRGVFYLEGAFRFNIIDSEGHSSGWVKLNERALGRLVADFDSTTDTLTLAAESGQQPLRLRLAASKVFDATSAPVAQAHIPVPPPSVSLPSLVPAGAGIPGELPSAVRAMMFPDGNAPRATALAHPSEAAPAAGTATALPPEVARYFPATPGPKWDSPVINASKE